MLVKTIRYLPGGGVAPDEIEVPDPTPEQVQVQAAACGICAWDLDTFKRGSEIRCPAPPGHEGIGYISKVGAAVTGWREGERVAGGGFAAVWNTDPSRLHRIPDSDLADEHWIVEPAACVVNGIDHCQVRPADRVVVIGCGFMGLMLVQVLGRSPLDQLICIDLDESRLALASEWGATETICAATADLEQVAAELKARQIDTVVDSSGKQPGLDLSSRIVRRGGRIVLFGWNRGPTTFSGDDWHLGGFTVINAAPAAGLRESMGPAVRLLHRGIIDLRPLVTHVVALDGYGPLLERVVTGRQPDYIKGVVTLS